MKLFQNAIALCEELSRVYTGHIQEVVMLRIAFFSSHSHTLSVCLVVLFLCLCFSELTPLVGEQEGYPLQPVKHFTS